MHHLGIAAIEHHIGVAHRRKVTGAVHQQQRDTRSAFKQKMDQPPSGVATLGMDEHTTSEGGVFSSRQLHRAPRLAYGGDVVTTEPQREGDCRQQVLVGAVDQDRYPWLHGSQLLNAWSSWT
ncbi:MAG: hypothetical protein WA708_03015 [Acidobacteriaceae bacterium]